MRKIVVTSTDIFLLYCSHKEYMTRVKQRVMCFADYRAEMLGIVASINK